MKPTTAKCKRCGNGYQKKSPRALYCVPCRGERKKERDRGWYNRTGRELKAERWVEQSDNHVGVDQGYRDLALAVLRQAVVEEDYSWVSEFGREFCRFAGHQLNDEQYRTFLLEVVKTNAQKE